jgi:hypothetical protein
MYVNLANPVLVEAGLYQHLLAKSARVVHYAELVDEQFLVRKRFKIPSLIVLAVLTLR